MSNRIMVGVKKAIDKIARNRDIDSVKWGNKREWEIRYLTDGVWYAYHYGTRIATFGMNENRQPALFDIGGAYSASDRDVINSMCRIFGATERVSIKGGYMHILLDCND